MKPKIITKDIKLAPNLQTLKEAFKVNEDILIIAYGDTIYLPKTGMSKDLLVHELVHCERQGFNAEQAKKWWERYMTDIDFRLQEEVIAYRKQFDFIRGVYKDRNKLDKILRALARELSSEMYGNIVSTSEAMSLLGS